MKKLLLALVASVIVLPAFASEAVVTSSNGGFDNTKIMCGSNHIGDGINAKQLNKFHCEKFQDHKTSVTFWDDNSKKLVHCKADKAGNIAVAECKAD